MQKNEIQFLFRQKNGTNNINGDSIIRLNSGILLFYHFRMFPDIYVYSEKTFQLLYEIDIYKLIEEYEKYILNTKAINIYNEEESNNNSIKELNNGLVLIGRNRYLIELNLQVKTCAHKIVKRLNYIISNINELPDKRIIVITYEKIIIIKKEKEEYITEEQYPIKENWKIKIPDKLEQFNQYYSSEILPNNRLLLNSFSLETEYHNDGRRKRLIDISESKIIIIDMNNFKEISSTETYSIDINIIVLENVIIIQDNEEISVYDINTLHEITNINFPKRVNILYPLDKKYLISICKFKGNNCLQIFQIIQNQLIYYYLTGINILNKFITWKMGNVIYNKKIIFPLKDKKFIIKHLGDLYLFKLAMD